MQIIEQFTCSKTGDPSLNEDALWIDETFCLVADGVTSKHHASFHGKTGGRIAVECMISALKRCSGDEDARTVLSLMQNEIRQFVKKHAIPDMISPQASALIYNRTHRELWSIGDCPFIINGTHYKNEKRIDQLLSQLRKVVIETLLMDGYTQPQIQQHDLSREMILPFLKLQPKLIDSDSAFSYSVIDGKHPAKDFKVIPIPEGSELILATDGYPMLKTSLAESEATLAKLISDDPLCFRLCPGTKGITPGNLSFDDRTYLKIIT